MVHKGTHDRCQATERPDRGLRYCGSNRPAAAPQMKTRDTEREQARVLPHLVAEPQVYLGQRKITWSGSTFRNNLHTTAIP